VNRVIYLVCAVVFLLVQVEAASAEDASWTLVKAMYRGIQGRPSPAALSPNPLSRDALYPLRDTPANAIEKLRQAYENMDAAAYLDCLAEDFIFFLHPDDVASNPWLPDYWDKSVEAAIHHNMFGEGTNVLEVILVLAQVGDPIEIPDPLARERVEWEFRENHDLRVYLPPDLILLAQGGGVYMLRVDPDESGPQGETLWEIYQWFDRDPFDVSPVESSSWTRIKSLFSS
jgi:hypothetical protein